MSPAGWAIAGLSLLLALSVAGNVAIGNAYLDKRDEVRDLTADRNQQRDAAQACSASVERIKTAAEKQTAFAAAAVAAARSAAVKRDERADQILSTPAAVPGNDCASAKARVDDWLSGRVGP